MVSGIISEVRHALAERVDEKSLLSSDRFFKEGERAKILGVRMADVVKIGKVHFKQVKELPKQEIFELCGKLWESEHL